jgi:hypothetical protein
MSKRINTINATYSSMAINKSSFETVITDENRHRINLTGGISISHPLGGCGLEGCSCSPGHWISVICPLQDGKVRGTLFSFDTREELEAFTLENGMDSLYDCEDPREEVA